MYVLTVLYDNSIAMTKMSSCQDHCNKISKSNVVCKARSKLTTFFGLNVCVIDWNYRSTELRKCNHVHEPAIYI